MPNENKSKVWIPQEPMVKDRDTGEWISKGFDLASASQFGSSIIVWQHGASILQRDMIEDRALEVARQYDELEDYVVCLGSPTLIAALGWAIGWEGKTLRVLEWDKRLKRYYPTLGETLQTGEADA